MRGHRGRLELRLKSLIALSLMLGAALAAAQDRPEDVAKQVQVWSGVGQPGPARPEDGGHEIEVWTGGGHSVSGGTAKTAVFNVGLRYGWILCRPYGPGFLKGRFEYAVDIVPVFMVFQPANTAYGAGFNPLNLKWNFATRGQVVPYFELSGGPLFSNHEVPRGTSSVNFTPSASLGAHFLRERYNWSLELRYLHISNAGLSKPNPGINTVQLRLGIGKFFSHSD